MSVTVALDANGADLGPAEVAAGAVIAAELGVRVRIFGPADQIGDLPDGIEVVDAPVSIAKDPDPARAARSTPEASIVQAARAVAEGQADALVSAGATGATLAAGLFEIKRARGIYRPALATPVPIPGSPVTLLDVGANVEVRSEHLVQFAFMGAALATTVLGQQLPRVALLSNGSEASRGTAVVIEAGEQLAAGSNPSFEFVGNIEGNDLAADVADVIVTDGFTGNIALKVMEGISQAVVGGVRDAATSSSRAKLGGALLRPALRGFRDEIDPEGPGGAYMLGLRQLAVVSHGRFTRYGFSQAILLAARAVSGDLVGRTEAMLEAGGALRRAGGVEADSPSGGVASFPPDDS
jgi:glycerol-3-phosphate acyltransferase PlsX